MPTLPNVLALETVEDGSGIIASEHRNNYSAIQTLTNALIGILDDGLSGQFLKGVGSTVSFDYPPGYQIGYVEFTAPVTITATTDATAQDVVSAGAVTFDGTACWFEFYAPSIVRGTSNILISLWEDATDRGRIAIAGEPNGTPCLVRRKLTPTAGSKTFKVKGHVDAGTGDVQAGAGGVATRVPGYIRITKA